MKTRLAWLAVLFVLFFTSFAYAKDTIPVYTGTALAAGEKISFTKSATDYLYPVEVIVINNTPYYINIYVPYTSINSSIAPMGAYRIVGNTWSTGISVSLSHYYYGTVQKVVSAHSIISYSIQNGYPMTINVEYL